MRLTLRFLLLWLAISAALLLVYWPALAGTPLMDDVDLFAGNEAMLSTRGLWNTWTNPRANVDFYPLTHSSWWLEWRLWGDFSPTAIRLRSFVPVHVANIILHALNAALVWLVARRLRLSAAIALPAALLFAVHPVNVESVAWMSQRKNVLSGAFYLLSACTFLRACNPDAASSPRGDLGLPTARSDAPLVTRQASFVVPYVLSIILFMLAMLAKPVAMTLAGALPLMAWHLRGRFRVKDALLALPYLALAVPMILITSWVQVHHVGTTGEAFDMPLLHRLLLAPRVACFYLWKLMVPLDLSFAYARWTIDPAQGWQWLFPLAIAGLVIALFLLRRRCSWSPFLAMLGFLIALSPALGFIPIYWHLYYFVADHVVYLAAIPMLLLMAAAVARTLRPSTHGAIHAWVWACVLLPCAWLSHNQSKIYRNAAAIWNDVLAKDNRSFLALTNLGVLAEHNGNIDDALVLYRRSLDIQPRFADTHYNIANVLSQQLNGHEEAIGHYRTAVEINPRHSNAWANLSYAYAALRQYGNAVAAATRAVELRPNAVNGRFNLGSALLNAGQPAQAIPELEFVLELKPDHAEAWLNIAIARLQLGEIESAREACTRAISINPRVPDGHFTLGLVHSERKDYPAAVDAFERAAELKPDDARVFSKLAIALGNLHRLDEALASCDRAILLNPSLAEAHCNRGAALAALNRLAEARNAWLRAIELDPEGEIGHAARQFLDRSLAHP